MGLITADGHLLAQKPCACGTAISENPPSFRPDWLDPEFSCSETDELEAHWRYVFDTATNESRGSLSLNPSSLILRPPSLPLPSPSLSSKTKSPEMRKSSSPSSIDPIITLSIEAPVALISSHGSLDAGNAH